MHDRVRAVDDLQFVVGPEGPLGALVLAVPDFEGAVRSAAAASSASKTSWTISQSPSCLLLKSLNA
jgi:hypothetical protein